jgi:hypothetical protein
MRGRLSVKDAAPVATWLGLVWVYSCAFWLLGLVASAAAGEAGSMMAMGVRLAASVVVGIGLCAAERWAWAQAICLTILYAAGAGTLALTAGWALLNAPLNVLSWKPVFLGLTPAESIRLAWSAAGVAAVSSGIVWLLWRAQLQFDVPYRRPYATLLRYGPWSLIPILGADLYLLYHWSLYH